MVKEEENKKDPAEQFADSQAFLEASKQPGPWPKDVQRPSDSITDKFVHPQTGEELEARPKSLGRRIKDALGIE